jgi:hypothetical protein
MTINGIRFNCNDARSIVAVVMQLQNNCFRHLNKAEYSEVKALGKGGTRSKGLLIKI